MMKTTKQHFKIFKAECERWIKFFGLTGWSIGIQHEHGLEDSRGWFGVKFDGRIASIGLEPDWQDDEITERKLKKCAFHEVVHLLLADLVGIATTRYVVNGAIQDEEHRLIRILENTVFARWGSHEILV